MEKDGVVRLGQMEFFPRQSCNEPLQPCSDFLDQSLDIDLDITACESIKVEAEVIGLVNSAAFALLLSLAFDFTFILVFSRAGDPYGKARASITSASSIHTERHLIHRMGLLRVVRSGACFGDYGLLRKKVRRR